MMKSLALPKGAKDELGIQGDNGMPPIEENEGSIVSEGAKEQDDEHASVERKKLLHERKMQRELYSEGRYHLIPGFFRTMMYLKKQKVEFALTFRTFG